MVAVQDLRILKWPLFQRRERYCSYVFIFSFKYLLFVNTASYLCLYNQTFFESVYVYIRSVCFIKAFSLLIFHSLRQFNYAKTFSENNHNSKTQHITTKITYALFFSKIISFPNSKIKIKLKNIIPKGKQEFFKEKQNERSND